MSAPAPRLRRLLLVEDNPGDVGLFTEALRETGAAVELTVATDGREALARLAGRRRLPELVLLDFNLPKMGGLALLRALKSDPRLRVAGHRADQLAPGAGHSRILRGLWQLLPGETGRLHRLRGAGGRVAGFLADPRHPPPEVRR